MKKQKENSHEGITWSEMGKQNVQAEKVYWKRTAARCTKLKNARAKRAKLLVFGTLRQRHGMRYRIRFAPWPAQGNFKKDSSCSFLKLLLL